MNRHSCYGGGKCLSRPPANFFRRRPRRRDGARRGPGRLEPRPGATRLGPLRIAVPGCRQDSSMNDSTTGPTTKSEVLHPRGPLSASTLWKQVAEAYASAGREIWSSVPAAVTGNVFVGDTFAAALEAWLLDQGDAVDVREPL